MKKLIPIILALLFLPSVCWAQGLTSINELKIDTQKKIYTCKLGIDNDDIEIGDGKSLALLKPQIKFNRWKKENYLTIKVPDTILSANIPQFDNTTKELKISNVDTEFYFKTYDDENFKFGLIFNKKPSTNTWSFQLEGWDEFDFLYQPELTQEEINHHCIRPDNVVGSYAVYHKTKKNHEIEKTNYATGKFCHIYRPKFIDANGDWVWADLDIKDGVYTITIAQTFLDKAKYPIKSNDQFGFSSVGGTSSADYSNDFWSVQWTNAPTGQITKAYIACKYTWRTGQKARVAMYANSSGSPGSLIANTDSGDMTITRLGDPTSDLATWTQANIASGFTMTSAATYWIAWGVSNTDAFVYYDWDVGISVKWKDAQTYSTFPPSSAPSGLSSSNAKWSVCYEYITTATRRMWIF